ncbi:MAG: flagellar basal body rod protein FlgB [bacterium]
MDSKLFDSTSKLLSKYLDLASMRHDTIANNVACVDVPGYKAVDLKFEEELSKVVGQNSLSLTSTNINHMPSSKNLIDQIKPRLVYENNSTMRNDLNDVNIDQEMAKLAENSIQYNTAVQLISFKLKMLGDAIRGGK